MVYHLHVCRLLCIAPLDHPSLMKRIKYVGAAVAAAVVLFGFQGTGHTCMVPRPCSLHLLLLPGVWVRSKDEGAIIRRQARGRHIIRRHQDVASQKQACLEGVCCMNCALHPAPLRVIAKTLFVSLSSIPRQPAVAYAGLATSSSQLKVPMLMPTHRCS